MRFVVYGLIVGVVLWVGIGHVGAQDATPTEVSGVDVHHIAIDVYQTVIDNNICPEELIAANRSALPDKVQEDLNRYLKPPITYRVENYEFDFERSLNLTVPPHDPCYDKFEADQPFTNLGYLEQQHNVCAEEIIVYGLFWGEGMDYDKARTYYIRRDAPACVNEKGQRLTYFSEDQQYLERPVYSDLPFVESPDDTTALGYCLQNLSQANPGITYGSWVEGDAVYWGMGMFRGGLRLFVPPETPYCVRFQSIALAENICPEELWAANRDLIEPDLMNQIELYAGYGMKWLDMPPQLVIPQPLVIPPHEDCYNIIVNNEYDIIDTYNICPEAYTTRDWAYIHDAEGGWKVYMRKDELPCVNEAGQRLQYLGPDGRWLETPVYSPLSLVTPENHMEGEGLCYGDLLRANPKYIFGREPMIGYLQVGDFMPQNARHCELISTDKTLYELSKSVNVCMEVLYNVTMGTFAPLPDYQFGGKRAVPQNAPPCYDQAGQRLGYKDRSVYTPQNGETFLRIAQTHDVCLDDLWDANPLMNYWDGWSYILPETLFIPDTPSCANQPPTFTIRPNQNLHTLSLLTNICLNRLREANPWITVEDWNWRAPLPAERVVTIPDRLPCYDYDASGYWLYGGHVLELQMYACYPIEITEGMDLTGHEPAINTSQDTDLPYCSPLKYGMTVYYDNRPYTLYDLSDGETPNVLYHCFAVPTIYIPDADGSPGQRYDGLEFPEALLIPQPHAACGLETSNEKWTLYQKMTYDAGYLRDGIYTVNYGDTLSSIGRTYGYLPQWIADANGIPLTYPLSYLQDLKMPPYPSLHTLVPIGGAGGMIMLASTAIYGLRRWMRRRHMDKKKNSDTK